MLLYKFLIAVVFASFVFIGIVAFKFVMLFLAFIVVVNFFFVAVVAAIVGFIGIVVFKFLLLLFLL